MIARAPGIVGGIALAVLAVSGPTASSDLGGPPGERSTAKRGAVDVRPTSESFGPTAGSHVEIVGADAWHGAGIDGSGVTVGIIDFFDVERYWNEAEHGPAPVAGATAMCFDGGSDCTDAFFDGVDEGGEDHGVAVVEAVLDTAPGVRILIGQATGVGDYRLLVDWFLANDVDVISRSLGSRYDGPGDGRGPLNDVVDTAVARGALWVNSAGNNGRNRYYRHPVRLVDERVAFGPSGDITFLPFTGCVALGGIRWANDWDVAPLDRSDYDAFLWESPTGDPGAGSIVATSQSRQLLGAPPIENIEVSRCPAAGSSLYLEIRWRGGDTGGDVLEILDYGSGIASFTSSAGSAAVSVVDSTNPGVLAVGAIDPADSGTVAPYSSRGPSNDGRTLPDLTAPGSTESSVQGRFAGTSAAAAVVAGAAALLVDAELANGPVALADLLRHLTIDRGDPGIDDEYGHGELRLPEPPPADRVDPAPSQFVSNAVPVRVLDTRAETAAGPDDLIGRLDRGDILQLPLLGTNGIPENGVTAVAVNIVSIDADRPSHVQALPTNAATLGAYSNLNIDAAGQTRSNFAIVPVGPDGSVSIYSIAAGHIVIDLLGWFESTGGPTTAGRFVELSAAQRLLDSRRDAPVRPLRSHDVRAVAMPIGIEVADIAALVVTVAAAEPTDEGWLQVFPSGRTDVVAATSTVNAAAGGAVANTAIVPVTEGGISVTGFFAGGGSADVVVDAVGYITSSAASSSIDGHFVAAGPNRAYDSRLTRGPLGDGETEIVDASAAPGVSIPDTASAVVWNATVVGVTRPGFARAWAADNPPPETSSVNWSRAGEVRAGAVISPVDAGRARFELDDGSADLSTPVGDLVLDVFGYFT